MSNNRGITLIAVGNRGYFNWAVNMACSIMYYSPKVSIQLLCAPEFKVDAHKVGLFDVITILPKSAYTDDNGRLFPAKLKLSMYDWIYYDEAIYLDVDGMLVRDITPLFDTVADISGDIQGVYEPPAEGAEWPVFNGLKWCKPEVIWKHYNLPLSATLPAINSSYMFIRKGNLTRSLFKRAYELLMNAPIPVENHWHKWGHVKPYKNTQPDELYFDIACAQMGIVPEHKIAVYFRMIIDRGDSLKLQDVQKDFYAVGLFGMLNTNHRSVREIYDAHMPVIYKAVMGGEFHNKSETLARTKFAIA